MALFVKQNDTRTELQKRLATELQEKAREKAAQADLPDGVTDSQFIKGTKQTSGLAGVWIAVIIGFIVATLWIIIAGASQ